MQWWQWVEASVAALLVVLLLALRFDTLRDRPGSSAPQALRQLAPVAVLIPAAFLIGLLGPWWLGLIAIAVPALALLAMAAAS